MLNARTLGNCRNGIRFFRAHEDAGGGGPAPGAGRVTRKRRRISALLRPVLGAALVLAAAYRAESGARSLRDVVYDYAVTSYCGVLTPEVEFGFRRELAQLTAHYGLTPEQAKAQRIAGWVAADREWANRGLGGFRAWCQTEGSAAVRHFQAIARARL